MSFINKYAELLRLMDNGAEECLYSCSFKKDYGLISELEESISEISKSNSLVNSIDSIVYKEDESGTIFKELFSKRERLIILGAGHVGEVLCKLAKLVGFFVVVCDDREELCNRTHFADADQLLVGDYRECIRRLKPNSRDYFTIVARDHECDTECLKEILTGTEPHYVGMIGSRRRTAIVFDELIKEGYDKERIAKVCTPIGLDIGAKTLEEIAVSIVAELIAKRRNGNLKDHNMNDIEAIGRIDEPHVEIILLSAIGSSPRKAGACMAILMDGTTVGSVGGGSAEAKLVEVARKLAGSGAYQIFRADFNDDKSKPAGMVCGGKIVAMIKDVC